MRAPKREVAIVSEILEEGFPNSSDLVRRSYGEVMNTDDGQGKLKEEGLGKFVGSYDASFF